MFNQYRSLIQAAHILRAAKQSLLPIRTTRTWTFLHHAEMRLLIEADALLRDRSRELSRPAFR